MVDTIAKLATAAAAILGVIAWPLVVGWFIYKFAPVIREFLSEVSEGSVKAWGVEASAKRERAAGALVRAQLKTENLSHSEDTTIRLAGGSGKSQRIADAITRTVPIDFLKGHSIL